MEASELRRRHHVPTDSDDELDVDASIPSTPFEEQFDEPFRQDLPDDSGNEEESTQPEAENDHGSPGDDGDHTGEQEEPDDRQCRICFGGAEEEDTFGRLISPCLCTGSVRYVHMKCINAWRGTGTNTKAFMECPQCHHQYHLRRTLVSGLATSRPLLLLLSTLLFTVCTLLTGSLLFYLLTRSSTTRRKLLTTSTIFDTEASDPLGTWTSDHGDTLIVVGIGGSLIYDVIVGSIQTFTRIALEFSDLVNDKFAEGFLSGLIFDLGIRFLLGLAVMGSFSFITLLFSVSLFGPFHIFNTVRGLNMFRNWTRRDGNGNARGGRGSLGQAMIILFVLIGTINTLWGVYRGVERVTHRMLVWMEAQILEVNPDERLKEKERRERRAREGYARRWIRRGGYKTWSGWKELIVRVGYHAFQGVKEKWREAKQGWTRGFADLPIPE